MATSLVSKIRNSLESNRFFDSFIYLFTQNGLYQKVIYWLALEKIKKVEREKWFGLAIEVSSFCNARCVFCPNQKMRRRKSNMNMLIFNKLIERVRVEKIKLRFVNLTGTGEPLMDKTLFEKIRLLKKNFPGVVIFMPTNFNLATGEVIERILASGLDKITISLNADNADEYKKIMKLNFNRTIKNINNLIDLRNEKKSNLLITMTIAASPINKASLSSFVKKWEARVDAVAVNWVHTWGGAVGGGSGQSRWHKRYPCRTLFEQIVVQSNGDIPMCCVDYEGKLIGGNIMKDKILDSFLKRKIGEVKKLHKNKEIERLSICGQCRFSERGMDWLV